MYGINVHASARNQLRVNDAFVCPNVRTSILTHALHVRASVDRECLTVPVRLYLCMCVCLCVCVCMCVCVYVCVCVWTYVVLLCMHVCV
jgi:hypothetical protein